MYNLAAYEWEVLRKLFNITFPRLRLFFTFFVKRDRGYFCLVKRDLRFDIFVIRDSCLLIPRQFLRARESGLELWVIIKRRFDLNVIGELCRFV